MAEQLSPKLMDEFRNLVRFNSIKCIVLFGSYARGEARPESDVDLFLITTPMRSKDKDEINQTFHQLEIRYEIRIQVVYTNEFLDRIERIFLETIIREGQVLVGAWPPVSIQKLALEPKMIVHYELAGLSQRDKMEVKRKLYGQTHTRHYKTKIYRSVDQGIVSPPDAERIGIGSVLATPQKALNLQRILEQMGAKVFITPIWISQI